MEIIDELGTGGSALILRVRHERSLKELAMRVVNKKNNPVAAARDKLVWPQINHSGLLKLMFQIETETLMMSGMLLAERSMWNWIVSNSTSLSILTTKRWLKRIIAGLIHLKGLGYSHGDIKLDNILYYRSGPKLADYDTIVTYSTSRVCEDPLGTILAPEMRRNATYNTELCDVYATAHIAIDFIGKALHVDDLSYDYEDLNEAWLRLDLTASSLIGSMLAEDPDERMELEDVINYRWLDTYSAKESKLDEKKFKRASYKKPPANIHSKSGYDSDWEQGIHCHDD